MFLYLDHAWNLVCLYFLQASDNALIVFETHNNSRDANQKRLRPELDQFKPETHSIIQDYE